MTDDKGSPIPNASVIVKGTNTGTVTKSDGTYSLTVPDNATALVFSSVNMVTKECKRFAQSEIDLNPNKTGQKNPMLQDWVFWDAP